MVAMPILVFVYCVLALFDTFRFIGLHAYVYILATLQYTHVYRYPSGLLPFEVTLFTRPFFTSFPFFLESVHRRLCLSVLCVSCYCT